jgi:hypothetical protein
MTARRIQNIRDLLIVAIAPDLQVWAEARRLHLLRQDTEAIIALVIDGLTPRSVELLAELHDKRRVGDLKLEKGKLDS